MFRIKIPENAFQYIRNLIIFVSCQTSEDRKHATNFLAILELSQQDEF